MATIIYNLTFTPTPGSYGTLVEYREQGGDTWVVPDTSPNPTALLNYNLVLETNTTYDIRVSANGGNCIKRYRFISLSTSAGNCCPDGYTLAPDESYCYQILDTSPTIIQSDICLTASTLVSQYSTAGTRLYAPGYGTDLSGSFTTLTTQPQWREISGNIVGPMNRSSVWVDTDCNGVKDPLTAGQVLQITIPVVSSVAKTIYVGIGGDNTFRLDVNGVTIVDRDASYLGFNFNYWHVFPVNINSGTNYFNFRAVGDGSTNDSFAAVGYDNTQTELTSATSDGDLNIIFQTQDYRGVHIDIATCPGGYFLDTSGGQGNYNCIQFNTTTTEGCA